MKAIVVREFGGPEVMKLEEVPTPRPASGQVLVRVGAAGVNPADTYTRSGTYAIKPPLPYTPGTDGAGIVEAIGEGVSRFRPGDRVYLARTISGSYAEFALATEAQVHSLPEAVSFSQGAGIYVPYGTAYHALFHQALAKPGETLLVHGASGGVGIAALQIAHSRGIPAFGTAGSPRGRELALREGAQGVFDHDEAGYIEKLLDATGGRGFDVILEMLANVNLGKDLKLLAPEGRVVIIGSRGDVTITPRDLMSRRAAIHAFTLWAVKAAEEAEIHAALAAGMESGVVKPVVGKELPLAEAAQSHRAVMEKGAFGKIVLVP
ncbi:MAG TPA: NADPH:quinone reductase [Rectinemataceae bacterium]|nr:NADPH:quinone reductase [Rectinemataceae bacterium]